MGTQLDENFWLDDKVHELGPIGIAVWTCIITGKHASDVNLPGLYKISCEDIFWQLGGDLMGPALQREVENAFWVIVGKGMAFVDPRARQLRLPNVWKYAPTPNPNQISGWKNQFLKCARTPFRSEHLPILRKLAERCLAGGVEMFDARFGLLDPDDNRTYHLGNTWKPGDPPLPGIRKWLLPAESPPASPGIDKDHLYLSRRREEETLTSTLTLTLNGGSRRVPEGFPNPSNGASGKTEENGGLESTQEGFSKGSGRVSETVPKGLTKGFENGSGRVSGPGEYDQSSERPTGERDRSGGVIPVSREYPTDGAAVGSTLPASLPGGDPEGRRADNVVSLPVPEGKRRRKWKLE
jgi:hypothetical protein